MMWGEAACHIIWLMNCTSTKAVDGMMPYEAAFGKKPDLWHEREWGEKVWVCIEGGNKLGGCMKEGRWLGIDEQSKGFCIYRPDKWTVTTERNVYYDESCSSVCHLKGEDWEFVETKTDKPESLTPENPAQTQSTMPPAIPSPNASRTPSPSPSDHDNPPDEQPVPAKRIRKLSQQVCNILEGRGATSAHPSDPIITAGVQVPPIAEEAPAQVLEGEGMADWMMVADFMDEYVMVVEMSDFEALEPRSLAEAKRCLEWPLWEKAIHEELATLQEAGTWELTDAPNGANIVGLKWVFHMKKDVAGIVVHHKACLVAQGFSQVPGVDYFDMFAPVAKLALI
jgi:Reverse transcriptase (RNA-dependent DNA polymerase)